MVLSRRLVLQAPTGYVNEIDILTDCQYIHIYISTVYVSLLTALALESLPIMEGEQLSLHEYLVLKHESSTYLRKLDIHERVSSLADFLHVYIRWRRKARGLQATPQLLVEINSITHFSLGYSFSQE